MWFSSVWHLPWVLYLVTTCPTPCEDVILPKRDEHPYSMFYRVKFIDFESFTAERLSLYIPFLRSIGTDDGLTHLLGSVLFWSLPLGIKILICGVHRVWLGKNLHMSEFHRVVSDFLNLTLNFKLGVFRCVECRITVDFVFVAMRSLLIMSWVSEVLHCKYLYVLC